MSFTILSNSSSENQKCIFEWNLYDKTPISLSLPLKTGMSVRVNGHEREAFQDACGLFKNQEQDIVVNDADDLTCEIILRVWKRLQLRKFKL